MIEILHTIQLPKIELIGGGMVVRCDGGASRKDIIASPKVEEGAMADCSGGMGGKGSTSSWRWRGGLVWRGWWHIRHGGKGASRVAGGGYHWQGWKGCRRRSSGVEGGELLL